MTVSELIDFLRTQQQDLLVAIEKYSEYCVIEATNIEVIELCKPRPDGWIQSWRPDTETQKYLVFPGN